MEPSKANTVGTVKNSPSLCTTRKTLQFFRACSGFFFFSPNTPKTSRVTWQANMDRNDECRVIHEFSVVKCCFCYILKFF